MKKLISALLLGTLLTSCYNTRLLVGDVKTSNLKTQEKVWTHHVIFGLVPLSNARQNPADHLPEGQENYVVKTSTSFVNALVTGVTAGIYTPTTTTYYVPKK
ncbi:Bor/Iss family lipoprotein [Flammeovirga sp. OC4]|uniref:Bor/Iss family lipoprotein n=1 Tax=Flammeovirga sp. OC4 TaxID=1382345 RepID=UPI0005C67E6C|nr:hypothetical protein [Flammeovirga sp. OC4]